MSVNNSYFQVLVRIRLKVLLVKIVTLYALGDDADLSHFSLLISHFSFERSDFSGGYCGGVPPLPIPNREVKPACADGTAMQCGRVGGRHFFLIEKPFHQQ